jgi:hypothetical protein
VLTAAMFHAPEGENLQEEGATDSEGFDKSSIQDLLKSALDDVKS